MQKRKLAAAFAGGVIGLVAFAAPAFAHVEIDPEEAPQGSTTTIAFHVPNEEQSTNTVKVDVKLPDAHPLATVTAEPLEGGWKAELVKAPGTGNVSEVIWTGGTIAPSASFEFKLTIGPLPSDVDELTFPTLQTYSDGKEVAWIDAPLPDGSEAEHPLPALKLTAGGPSSSVSTAPTSAPASTSTSVAATVTSAPTTTAKAVPAAKKDSSSFPVALVIVGAIVVLAVIGGLVVRARRSPGQP